MADLRFAITGAAPVAYAASPLLALDVRIETPEPVESLLLRTSVRIEAGARETTPEEEARLKELFGTKEQWSRGSRSVLWTQVVNVVSAFTDASHVPITLPVSYDLAAIASKYLRALDGGVVPIRAQFAGTAFFRREQGLSAAPIALDREASFELPVQTFNEVVEQHFPGSAIITLKRELFDRLEAVRIERGLSSFDHAIEALLSPRASRPARTKRGLA
jgi:hypothetical protein